MKRKKKEVGKFFRDVKLFVRFVALVSGLVSCSFLSSTNFEGLEMWSVHALYLLLPSCSLSLSIYQGDEEQDTPLYEEAWKLMNKGFKVELLPFMRGPRLSPPG